MVKHTQGEWKIVDGHRIETEDYGLIANVRGDLTDSETKANARLIAAAPKLLQALKDAITSISCSENSWLHEQLPKWEAAIAAATVQS